jgi:hypothetical protein
LLKDSYRIFFTTQFHMKLFLPEFLGKYSKDYLGFQMDLLDRTGHGE